MTEIRIECGVNSDGIRVEIVDPLSSVTVAGFNLDPEQIWQMMRGGIIHAEGEISSVLDRVGKTMTHESIVVPTEAIAASTYKDREAAGERWARKNHPGWDSYSAHKNSSGGVRVIARKWRD
jgi:hypothetical protein